MVWLYWLVGWFFVWLVGTFIYIDVHTILLVAISCNEHLVFVRNRPIVLTLSLTLSLPFIRQLSFIRIHRRRWRRPGTSIIGLTPASLSLSVWTAMAGYLLPPQCWCWCLMCYALLRVRSPAHILYVSVQLGATSLPSVSIYVSRLLSSIFHSIWLTVSLSVIILLFCMCVCVCVWSHSFAISYCPSMSARRHLWLQLHACSHQKRVAIRRTIGGRRSSSCDRVLIFLSLSLSLFFSYSLSFCTKCCVCAIIETVCFCTYDRRRRWRRRPPPPPLPIPQVYYQLNAPVDDRAPTVNRVVIWSTKHRSISHIYIHTHTHILIHWMVWTLSLLPRSLDHQTICNAVDTVFESILPYFANNYSLFINWRHSPFQ